MKTLLTGLFICLFGAAALLSSAQSDTTDVEVYDVLYLKKGGIMKGEIMSFDEPTGGLVFKDQQGRIFSYSREEYNYFKENQVFQTRKKKKDREIRDRKENELEFGIGLSANFINISEDFTSDDYYVQGNSGTSDIPLCFDVNVGKYFDRKHYIGATADIALSSSGSYFAAGFRYMHQYDGKKGNVGFYIPIEMKYNQIKNDVYYFTSDTTFSNGGYSYPSIRYVDFTMNSVMFSVGHGFAFILNDKKSFMLEAAVVKHFATTTTFQTAIEPPKSTLSAGGVRFAVKFNF